MKMKTAKIKEARGMGIEECISNVKEFTEYAQRCLNHLKTIDIKGVKESERCEILESVLVVMDESKEYVEFVYEYFNKPDITSFDYDKLKNQITNFRKMHGDLCQCFDGLNHWGQK